MHQLLVLDSVTHLLPEHRGRAALCASHGGTYAAYLAASCGVGAVILNDAGIGRERAGIAGLALLDALGVPAAAISHRSARIGDGAEGAARGVLSFVNAAAKRHGLEAGMASLDALRRLSATSLAPSPKPKPLAEARFEIAPARGAGVRITGIDSTSLVAAEDAGQVVITASHGGLLGNKPATAIKYDVRAAVFNDAGGGIDGAGTTRLPALDARGIAGACVSCFSARIGDARSTYEDGYISVINRVAAERGAEVGQSCKSFAAQMADEWR